MNSFMNMTGNVLLVPSRKMTIFRGVLLLILGVILFLKPLVAILVLSLIFGIALLGSGVVMLIQSKQAGALRNTVMLTAVFMIILGTIFIYRPGFVAILLSIMLALYLLTYGVAQLYYVTQRRNGYLDLFFPLVGVISIIAGVFILFNPEAGIIGMSFWLGIFFASLGMFNIILGSNLK